MCAARNWWCVTTASVDQPPAASSTIVRRCATQGLDIPVRVTGPGIDVSGARMLTPSRRASTRQRDSEEACHPRGSATRPGRATSTASRRIRREAHPPAWRSENRRLRREAGPIPGPAVRLLARNWQRPGELVSGRALRFPETGPGTSSKRCHSHFVALPRGPSFICSKNQYQRSPTRSPRRTHS